MPGCARRHTHPSKAQRGNHRPSSFRLRTRQDHRHARPLDRRYEYLPTCIDSSPPHLRSMRGASRVRLESRVHFCGFDARVTHDWRVRASHGSRDGCKPLLQVPPGSGSASAQCEREPTARPRSRSTARAPTVSALRASQTQRCLLTPETPSRSKRVDPQRSGGKSLAARKIPTSLGRRVPDGGGIA